MPNLNYTQDVMFLSSNYMKMQNLPEAINHHAAAVGVCNKASKTQVISTLINAILFDVEGMLKSPNTSAQCSSQTVIPAKRPHQLPHASIPPQLVQRRLRWIGNAVS